MVLTEEELLSVFKTEDVDLLNESDLNCSEIQKDKHPSSKRKSKSSNKSKETTSRIRRPRISYYESSTGKMIKTLRCITCSSFVRKSQPQCKICLSIPGGIQGNGVLKKYPRLKCIHCGRRTKCRDGICLICKRQNPSSMLKTKVLYHNHNKHRTKFSPKVTVVKSRKQNKTTSSSNSNGQSGKITSTISKKIEAKSSLELVRGKTPVILLRDINIVKKNYTRDVLTNDLSDVVSDLDNLLNNP